MTREQVIRNVRHLVQKRVDERIVVALEHQVDVQRDLLNPPPTAPLVTRHHVAQSTPHAVAQAERKVLGKAPLEACRIEVEIQGSEVARLPRSGAAGRFWAVSAPFSSLAQCGSQGRPRAHDRGGPPATSGGAPPALREEIGERIQQLRGG
jgi:hypothetical protein